jgi:hypothetical protein
LDVLHLADGQSVKSPGGAGLYTALAAARAGARAAMYAPHPDPMPDELRAAAQRITWIGPDVPPDQLPRFEIAHHGGGRATLVNAFWGGEMLIAADSFTADQLIAPIVHIGALRTAATTGFVQENHGPVHVSQREPTVGFAATDRHRKRSSSGRLFLYERERSDDIVRRPRSRTARPANSSSSAGAGRWFCKAITSRLCPACPLSRSIRPARVTRFAARRWPLYRAAYIPSWPHDPPSPPLPI